MAPERSLDGGSSPSPSFFEKRQPPAVLKHAILRSYLHPFVAKTGSTSPEHRVAILDGFAGAGRYSNGEPGSPEIIATTAGSSTLRNRRIEALFVESDEATYAQLCAVLAEVAPATMIYHTYCGRVEQYLDDLLAETEGVPLLAFLDPFGLGISFGLVRSVFNVRPPQAWGAPTEVLLRVDCAGVRRILGVFRSSKPAVAKLRQTIEHLDRAAGGSWWRDEDDGDRVGEDYLRWFMDRLLEQWTSWLGCVGWYVAVKQRPALQPAYYLLFLTRHPAGMDAFLEAVSLGQEKWRRALFDNAVADDTLTGQESLHDAQQMFDDDERQMADQWQESIERNIASIMRRQPGIVLRDELFEVYGPTFGLARRKHLRAALKQARHHGLIATDVVGVDDKNLYDLQISSG